MRVALVGVGRMGGAIARRLLDVGHEVCAYDVRGEELGALAAHPSGRGSAARSAREAAARSELIGIAVLDDAQLLDALLGRDGVLAGASDGAVVMIHSTVALATLRRAGDEAARRGVALIEAAVSGRDGHRSVGELCVMVGGERAAFERARPALDAIGSLVLHLGPLGAGMDAKLVRNAIVYQQFVAGHEGMLLAEKLGVARADVRAILEHTGVLGANLASFLDEKPGSSLLAGTAPTARKDLAAALERAAEVGASLPGVALARERIAVAFGAEPPPE